MSARRGRAAHRVDSPISRPRRGSPARHSPAAVELLALGAEDRERPARHLRVPAPPKHAALASAVGRPPLVVEPRPLVSISASTDGAGSAGLLSSAPLDLESADSFAPTRHVGGHRPRSQGRRAAGAGRSSRRSSRSSRSGAPRLLAMLAIALCIAVGMRTFALQMFFIPSASMEPTLCGGTECTDGNDRILVNKLSYRFHSVERGDVVVFARPAALNGVTTDSNLVKRVVGVAGDSVRWDRADLYINNVKQHETYVDQACNANPSQWVGSTVVPAGDVFVMGDNRCDSEDSRIFGPIETKSIVGKAFIIVWPVGRIRPL